MMSKKQLACMFTLHVIYLLLGASIFYHIESPVEMAQRAEDKLERLEIQNLLYENYIPTDPEKQDSILRKLSDYCGKSMFNYTTEDEEPPIKWDFYHSVFFSYTVVSTIGYGNLAPTTHLSRILMIFYGLFGIPINGILLANLGEYFGLQVITVYRRYRRRDARGAHKLDYFFHNLGMLGQIFLCLIPGFLLCIFLPACLFMVFEGWDYVASVYYAFVTLTTIGFGDIVAGTINNGFNSGYFISYQIFLLFWITFGLGYIVMLLGFITSGMRSEGVHKLEQKLTRQLKSTQNRILSGFSKDINVIRKLINEANLIKLKPVYIETAPFLYKSKSCPTFTFDIEPRGPIGGRKRANSENITLSTKDLLRIQSDTNLLGIDKEKTFNASAIVKPAELLARVVNVLGGLEPQAREQKGVHMFGDEEILASEKSPWTIGQETIINNSPKRTRASSVAVPNYRKDSVPKTMDHELTWTNGDSPDKYIEAMNVRIGKMSLPTSIPPQLQDSLEEKDTERWSKLAKLFRKQSSTENPDEYLNDTNRGRTSVEHVVEKPKERRRGSIFPTFEFAEEEDTSAIQKYKQKKRHSIFPTFDFNEPEEDLAKKYKETTKRGRHSIFPTFDFSEHKSDEDDDDDIDEEEIRKYQSKTNRGRVSLFPTFGKKKSKEDEEDDTLPEDSEELKSYQQRTQKGRLSLFPTFGKKKSVEEDDDEDDTMPEDSEELKSYQQKTQRGRLSLFPTFGKKKHKEEEEEDDTMPDDSEELKKYQQKTQKGRLSLFPTFGKKKSKEEEDDDDTMPEDSDELKKYQQKTQKGRLSLFPTFGKKKEKEGEDDDSMPDDSEELRSYQQKTKKGRLSLFPTFGKNKHEAQEDNDASNDLEASVKKFQRQHRKGRKGSDTDDVDEYRKSTHKGRGSLFEEDSNNDQMDALEQTSVADLLRALTVLEATGPHDKRASLDAGGLLHLLAGAVEPSAAPPPNLSRRRGSIRPDFVVPPMPVLPPIPTREEKSTVKEEPSDSSGPRRRRVSGRGTAPHFTPSLATVVAGAELQTTAKAARENRMNMISPPQEESEESQPRTRRYSPAPGGPGKTSTGPVPRLFSRIRKESVDSIEEEPSSRKSSLTEVVIDNNKDVT